jgi:hypothetical protein
MGAFLTPLYNRVGHPRVCFNVARAYQKRVPMIDKGRNLPCTLEEVILHLRQIYALVVAEITE